MLSRFIRASLRWDFLNSHSLLHPYAPKQSLSLSRERPISLSHCFGITEGSKTGSKEIGKERMWVRLREGRENGAIEDPRLSSKTFFHW